MNTFDSTSDSNKNKVQDVDMLVLQDQSSSEESEFEESEFEESDFEGSDFDDSDSDYPSDFEEDEEEIARNERVLREIEEKEKQLAQVTKQVEVMKKFMEMMNNIQRGSDEADKMKNHICNILQENCNRHNI